MQWVVAYAKTGDRSIPFDGAALNSDGPEIESAVLKSAIETAYVNFIAGNSVLGLVLQCLEHAIYWGQIGCRSHKEQLLTF